MIEEIKAAADGALNVPPGYTYDWVTNRYRNSVNGRFVATKAIYQLLDVNIGSSAEIMRGISEVYSGGSMRGSVWLTAMTNQLRRLHVQNAALGAGGFDRLSPRDWTRIDALLREEVGRLVAFGWDIMRGKLSLKQIANRVNMYAGTARREFFLSRRRPHTSPNQMVIERRHLGIADHCEYCLYLYEMGWQPYGVLPVPGESSPAWEDDQCFSNCRCNMEIRVVSRREGMRLISDQVPYWIGAGSPPTRSWIDWMPVDAPDDIPEGIKGGPGSGYHEPHLGRPGERGGSAPRDGYPMTKLDPETYLPPAGDFTRYDRSKFDESTTVAQFEQSVRSLDGEIVALFRRDGRFIANFSGDKESVSIPGFMTTSVYNGVISHNHPAASSTSLSPMDVLTAINLRVREVRAVTPAGVYSMTFDVAAISKNRRYVITKAGDDSIRVSMMKSAVEKVRTGEMTAQAALDWYALARWQKYAEAVNKNLGVPDAVTFSFTPHETNKDGAPLWFGDQFLIKTTDVEITPEITERRHASFDKTIRGFWENPPSQPTIAFLDVDGETWGEFPVNTQHLRDTTARLDFAKKQLGKAPFAASIVLFMPDGGHMDSSTAYIALQAKPLEFAVVTPDGAHVLTNNTLAEDGKRPQNDYPFNVWYNVIDRRLTDNVATRLEAQLGDKAKTPTEARKRIEQAYVDAWREVTAPAALEKLFTIDGRRDQSVPVPSLSFGYLVNQQGDKAVKGGPGSGYHSDPGEPHLGRPGEQGGSLPRGAGGIAPPSSPAANLRKRGETVLRSLPRVWTSGQSHSVRLSAYTPTKLDSGAAAERAVIKALSTLLNDEFRNVNQGINNAPVDVFGDHVAVEVKSGLTSNSMGAQQWRVTLGQPGVKETEALKLMTPDEKRAHNERKMQHILRRKQEKLAEFNSQHGETIKPLTVGVIISADMQFADLYAFDGFHARLGWSKHAVEENYVGTVRIQ